MEGLRFKVETHRLCDYDIYRLYIRVKERLMEWEVERFAGLCMQMKKTLLQKVNIFTTHLYIEFIWESH